MSSIEEKLWDYIDGSVTADDQKAISLLIEQDEVYRSKYLELLKLNQEFSAMELDEPSMAFTYNVMEAIRTENAQKPLKATINHALIKVIFAFFVFIIGALVLFLLANIKWTGGNMGIQLDTIKLPAFKNYFTGPVMKGFFYFDIILGLFFFDSYLRKRSFSK
jgi:hypothetical protein